MFIPQVIRIEEITLTLEEDESLLESKILKILWIKKEQLQNFEIVKKAIDSRNKWNILIVYSVNVNLENNEAYFSLKHNSKILDFHKRHKVRLIDPFVYQIKKPDLSKLKKRPVVIGTGPSGLFVALALSVAGMKPIVLERWADVHNRVLKVHKYFTAWELDLNTNVQFGEWGAGTFSDGKLYTLVNDPRSKFIFEELVEAWAPKEIIYSARPHIGTDRLRWVVRNMRKKIIALWGDIRFETMMTDIEVENNQIKAVITSTWERIETDDLIVGIWHSARETYEMLFKRWVEMKQKPFAVWLRIEHPREMINKSQFGDACHHIKLPTASYKLVSHHENNRSVYSFCMCPGGHVVGAASEEWLLTVNGMSEYAQNSINSNSALLVNVMPSDFGSDHPLAWVEFQRKWERATFLAGWGGYKAPAQRVEDFLLGRPSTHKGSIDTTFKPELTMTDLSSCLPDFVIAAIREAIPLLDKKIKWFAHPDALLIGIEARTSAVVRFTRDEKCESNIKWIFPTGEGAWYAGGITSSSIDWLIVSESVIAKYM